MLSAALSAFHTAASKLLFATHNSEYSLSTGFVQEVKHVWRLSCDNSDSSTKHLASDDCAII